MEKVSILTIFVLYAPLMAMDNAPVAELEKGRFDIGLSWSGSDIDIEIRDSVSNIDFTEIIKGIDIERYTVDLGLAVTKGIEIVLNMGASTAEPDAGSNRDNVAGYLGESDNSFLFGGGIKMTLYEDDFMKWGLSAMVSHSSFGFEGIDDFSIVDVNYYSVEADAVFTEAVISTGPTVKVHDNISIYGGPFIHIISGDLEVEGDIEEGILYLADQKDKFDFRQDSLFGGLIGANVSINDRIGFNLEYQKTNSASAFTGGMIFKF